MTSSAVGGIRFGQYTLLRRIARGGMAEVFLAQQKGLEGFDRRVAVKRILPHLADAPDFVKMFLGEAKLAAQLTHPNVVHIYDFGKHDGDYFIAMEFVDGIHTGELYRFGVETEKLPPVLVARIGADAATALHYAHEQRGADGKPLGLVHRDVSPANIMVSYDGVVKLCDFGIAKAAALGEQLTNPGQVKGKYAYMSPEQTTAAPLDGRSDVFSLAIVLWELLAGKTIVGRGDAVEAMRAIRDGKLPPISSVAPHTPPQLAQALTWAMQTRREQRATAMDFAQALEAYIKSSPELATPMQLAGWIRQRFPRENLAALTPPSMGTRASGTGIAPSGTAVHSGTAASLTGDTPVSSLIAASRIHDSDDLDSAETIGFIDDSHTVEQSNYTVERNLESMIVDEPTREAVRDRRIATLPPPTRARGATVPPRRAPSSEPTVARSPSSEMTAARPMGRSPSSEMTVQAGAMFETTDRHAPTLSPDATTDRVPPAPFAAGYVDPHLPLMTEVAAPLAHRRAMSPEQRRNAIAIGVLGSIAFLSFVIALAAKSCSDAPTPLDAPPREVKVVTPLDAPTAPIDAPVDAPIVIDAQPTVAPIVDASVDVPDAREPTIRPDVTSVLEVRTQPEGGTIRVSTIDELRIEPARFTLSPGEFEIVAELPGYASETRSVTMERGVDALQEIVFATKRPGRVPAMGKLTVQTTPYSVVSVGGKLLGETPFADRSLPAGTHTLTFKNPTRKIITKKVTITPNKTTKVAFEFP